MATYGTIGGIISAVDLQYCMPIVVLALFVLAFLSAFLYYNKISFYIGYIIVFKPRSLYIYILFTISIY